MLISAGSPPVSSDIAENAKKKTLCVMRNKPTPSPNGASAPMSIIAILLPGSCPSIGIFSSGQAVDLVAMPLGGRTPKVLSPALKVSPKSSRLSNIGVLANHTPFADLSSLSVMEVSVTRTNAWRRESRRSPTDKSASPRPNTQVPRRSASLPPGSGPRNTTRTAGSWTGPSCG
ncbi:hypothetical protein GCM10025778_18670 [Paeniglutamicibacter antarcticus]|uniref:Uncharacterized protein n=1 Tax=Paeniglutamicibacter antarcticus TaxID=494023 RepID=A0ABP9TQG0_9MICC